MALLVNDTTPRIQYTATASQTTFAYPFEIFADADLKVYQTLSGATPDDSADILTLTTHYTVTNAGVTGGGDVVLVTGAAAGDVITIERDIAVERTSDYQNLGDLASESFNDDLDKIIMMIQQNELALERVFKLSSTDTTSSIILPAKDDRASKYLGFNTSGDPIVGTPIESTLVSTAMEPVVSAATLAAGRTALAVPGLAEENTFTKTQIWTKGSDVASASALTVGDGNYFDVTGTTTITSIATVGIGAVIKLHFDGALTLTHHATDLILPSGANITTAAGDEAEFVEYATGDWRCTNYTKANGKAVVETGILVSADITVDVTNRSTSSTSFTDSSVSITGTLTNSANKFRIRVHGIYGGNASTGSFTLYRDAVDLTASGVTSMTAVVCGGTGDSVSFDFEFEDSPADTSAHTYKLYWKTSTGTSYLGRRASDTTIDAPTIMTLEEITV